MPLPNLQWKSIPEQTLWQLRPKLPPDPKHAPRPYTFNDKLRREVLIRTFLKNFNLKKKTMRNIRRHARGPHLRDLFRALRERPIKLRNMRRGKDRWKWEAVFKEHITDQMCVSERQNGSLCTRLSKKLKSEYHNFMSKRLV
ncbi:hypothetical protein AAMO2058_000270000 [Amorphochlora amoebiformis]